MFFKPNIEKMIKKRDVKGLIKALKHKDSSVRKSAIFGLKKIGDGRAVEPLIQARKKDEINRVWIKGALEEVLARIWDMANRQHMLSDDRLKLVYALGEIGEPAIKPLIQALKDIKDIRFVAAEALVRIGEPAVEPLISTLTYTTRGPYNKWADQKFMEEIPEILVRIGEPAVKPLIDALPCWGEARTIEYIAKTLVKLGDARAAKPLTHYRYLGGPTQIQNIVHRALVDIGKPAVKPLIEALTVGPYGGSAYREPDEDEVLYIRARNKARIEAMLILVDIGEPAVEPLIQKLKNSPARAQVAEALGRIGDARAVKPLTEALKDKDEDVRESAKKAIEKIKAKKS